MYERSRVEVKKLKDKYYLWHYIEGQEELPRKEQEQRVELLENEPLLLLRYVGDDHEDYELEYKDYGITNTDWVSSK